MKRLRVFRVNITIEAFSEDNAIKLLKKEIIDENCIPGDMSMHPAEVTPYIPYMYVSSSYTDYGIDQEWLDENKIHDNRDRNNQIVDIFDEGEDDD